MKRIPWKELLLVSAPIGIIGLGIRGVEMREPVWPTKARIIECRVRPPVPLEVFQGADVGVTVRAVYPRAQSGCKDLRCSFARPRTGQDNQRRYAPVSLWTEQYSEYHSRKLEYEDNYAFRRSDFDSSQQLLIATPSLVTSCKVWSRPVVQEPVLLSAKEIPPIDPASVRSANFRVTKVEIEDSRNRTGQQIIHLHFADVTDECPGLTMQRRVVGNWKWQEGKTHSLRASAGMSSGNGKHLVEVQITLETGGLKLPPPARTKISGLLSLNGGWPQEITVVWPDKLDKNWALTEAKFSTKLAPLPRDANGISRLDAS